MLLYAGIAAAVLLFGLVIEILAQRISPADLATSAVPLVQLTPPKPVPPAVFDEELAPEPEPTIDVSEPIADAKAQYEAGEYHKAIATLEQVVSDAPKSVPAWLLLGLARYDANENAEANQAVEKVLELDPNNARGYILRSALLVDSGDKPAARSALEKALEVDPGGPYADEARALLTRP